MSVLKLICFLSTCVILTFSFPTISHSLERETAPLPSGREVLASDDLLRDAEPIHSASFGITLRGPKKLQVSGSGTLVVFPLKVEAKERQQPSSLRLYCGARGDLIKNSMERSPGKGTGISHETGGETLPTINLIGGLGIDINETVSLELEGGLDRKHLEDYTVLVTLTFRGR